MRFSFRACGSRKLAIAVLVSVTGIATSVNADVGDMGHPGTMLALQNLDRDGLSVADAARLAAGAKAYQHGKFADARSFLLPLARAGNAAAENMVGTLYDRGRGVPRDFDTALGWYRKAAAQGRADAQHNLGMMYYFGRGVAQDWVKAARWFQEAAEQGLPDSQGVLGFMYHEGQGLPADDVQGAMWLMLATDNGLHLAGNELAFVERTMTPAQIAEARQRAHRRKVDHHAL